MSDNEGSTLGSALESKRSRNASNVDAETEAWADDEEVKFNARVPKGLRDAFQEICESEGRPMSWVVREYMRKVVREGETGM